MKKTILVLFLISLPFISFLTPVAIAQNLPFKDTARIIFGIGNGNEDTSGGPLGPIPDSFKFYCQYALTNDAGVATKDQYWNYPRCDIYGSGCGPTSYAMIASSLGKNIDPSDLTRQIKSIKYDDGRGIGCGCSSAGECGTFISDYPNIKRWFNNNGMKITDTLVNYDAGTINLNQVREYLEAGYYIAAGADVQYAQRGGWSGKYGGHMFVITGISGNDLQVMDPTFCRPPLSGGARKLTDVNNLNRSSRSSVSRWIVAYAIGRRN